MTEKAYTDSAAQFSAALHARSRPVPGPRTDIVVSLPTRPPESSDDRQTLAKVGDWSSALELVEEASEAIRISEERANELEVELDHVMNRAAEEMRRLNAELTAAEQKAARSEERLRAAESRASEAEAWLVRLHQAVHDAFSPLQRRSATQAPAAREGA
ncbi:hypothetical protein [Methylopila sp. M107]|uniref:hypothetical protein n=1 Tax=Methylopila sp. M107 TaxID=1101190 RepID=UPI000364C757|nr:hypothetical protein [Methylopila sp. M107]